MRNEELYNMLSSGTKMQIEIALKNNELLAQNLENSGAVTTVIQDNKNITNTSNNTTEQTPDLSISGTDSTARALTAMGYGIP